VASFHDVPGAAPTLDAKGNSALSALRTKPWVQSLAASLGQAQANPPPIPQSDLQGPNYMP
jgi:hypothetical protein